MREGKMSVTLIFLTLICNVLGNGGGGLGNPGNSEYFLSYLDNSLAKWPIFSQRQGKPLSKTYSNVATFIDGDQDNNLAGWPTLGQNQDDPSSKSQSHVFEIVDGDRRNQFWPKSQSNILLGYLLGETKDKAATAEKPEPPSKCTVENNLKISSFRGDEITTKKLEEQLERFSDAILRQTERLISENHVKLQEQLLKVIEEKTETIVSNAVDKLLVSMETKLINLINNGSSSTENPNLDTKEVATIPSFNDVIETTTMYNSKTSEEVLTNTTFSGKDDDSELPIPKLVAGEGDEQAENDRNFTRTTQQMPSGIPGSNSRPFYLGLNRPFYTNSSPHGLRRRPQSALNQKPQF